jgi:hypothetical protein
MQSALKEIVGRYGDSGSSSEAFAGPSTSPSVEMQNLQRAPVRELPARQVTQRAVPGPADESEDEPAAEELPVPPPVLTPPQNAPSLIGPANRSEVAAEHSILSK